MYFFILILFLLLSPILSGLTLEFYRRMPGGWLCEWGESPGGMHMSGCRCGNGRKVWLFFTLTYIISLLAAIFVFTYNLPSGKYKIDYVLLSAELLYFCAVLFLLLIASVSDLKYMIIPDQMSAAAAVMAALRCAMTPFFCISAAKESFYAENLSPQASGAFSSILSSEFIILLMSVIVNSFKPMAVGALSAGGSAVFAGLISAAIYRREVMGFGDIKLITACGALAGSFAEFFPLKFQSDMSLGSISPLIAGFMVYAGAVILSAVYFSVRILFGKLKTGEEMPLAPWIAVSAVFTILACAIF